MLNSINESFAASAAFRATRLDRRAPDDHYIYYSME